MMQDTIRKYATRAVPRYTSYPTAPHFRPDFEAEAYVRWLAATDPAQPISLYLHVPFCKQMCWYCGCNMKLAARYAPIAAYVDDLIREIELVAAALPARMQVAHLHWGGGTPTALSPDDLTRVMVAIDRHFAILPDAELAIESDPRTLTDRMIGRLGELGFNRASFGVQEFDPEVQKAINRIQPPEMVERTVDQLRAVGIERINFDLIYGLPHQTTEKLLSTIARAVAMRPDRIALFGYAHVPWMAKNQRMIEESALPDAAERARQAEAASTALQRAGYIAIGLDHFALPDDPLSMAARSGRLHRNFQGYTTDAQETLVGLGATSIGRTAQGYVQNITETGAWARAVGAGTLPVAKGIALNPDDRLRAWVIERIMCDGAVDTEAAARRFNVAADWAEAELLALTPLEADGILERQGGRITLTPEARPLTRLVAAAFDTYFQSGRARHSAAV
jgi:oxygen-independent coproporphyrinogen III oxidase